MKTLIIAAGGGTRLKDLTDERPKALVPVLGMPLIERVILTARQAGIKEYVIVTGYLGEKIKVYLGGGESLGVKIEYVVNSDWKIGNSMSVLKARELMDEEFVLLMSDHIYDVRILKGILKSGTKSPVTLAIDRRKPLDGDTKVLEKDGKIVAIGKSLEKSNAIDTGIFLCSPKLFSYLDKAVEGGKSELSEGIARAAMEGDASVFDITQIAPYVPDMRKDIRPFCVDVDMEEDAIRASNLIIENACKGNNDFLATYVNKPIENFIVKRVAGLRVTPNQITLLTNIFAYASTILFFKGYLLFGSLLTFVVSFLDGVDGKLSRVKLSFSNIGKMEHAFDFLFEHSWYLALGFYLSKTHGIWAIFLPMVVLLFDGFSGHCERAFGKAFKIELVDFGIIERAFRKFDARKNSYIIFILVGILLDLPFYSLAVMAFWSFVSAGFYCVRAMKHLHELDLADFAHRNS
jgi:CDP-L-myo-inositol myo-inositolphosphotransferase